MGSVVAMLDMAKLPPAREWLDTADELRGGKLGWEYGVGGSSYCCCTCAFPFVLGGAS